VPLINQDAISTKAFTEMAAAADKCNGTIPLDDTVSALDDVLSVVICQWKRRSVHWRGKKAQLKITKLYCIKPISSNITNNYKLEFRGAKRSRHV
jgi:hypothetical protein